MRWFANMPINRKLTAVIIITCVAALSLAGTAMIAVEFVTARRAMVEDMTVLADLLGRNSTAPLSFHREEDVEEVQKILSALKADPHITMACLFDKEQRRFGDYVTGATASEFPSQPPPDGAQFKTDYLELACPVQLEQKRIGTIYLRADLGRISNQIAVHTGIVGLVLIVTIGIATILARRLRRPIAEPILALADIARRVAQNKDYSARAPKIGHDEIGLLTDAFNQMLNEIESGQRFLEEANEFLLAQSREIASGINILASSSHEILTASMRLASGAAHVATAIHQTTTTVNGVRETAQASNQTANYVAENAQKVVQTSLSGKKSVVEMIDVMDHIRHQAQTIGQSMESLTGQTQAIGEIIAAVDDLAAQSNLLAVNASIEAAKAGDQGKGFVVVAQEVRNLAEQSRQATHQVRKLLNDVQKATTTAVLAIERGNKAVEAGIKQSSQSGESIETLSKSVTEAAQAAAQIAASSQQQLLGVDEVASAMASIRQATSENASSSRQLEAAAHSLKELGEKLKQCIQKNRPLTVSATPDGRADYSPSLSP